MNNQNQGFLKRIFGGSSVLATIVSGLIVGMVVQWMARKKSSDASTESFK